MSRMTLMKEVYVKVKLYEKLLVILLYWIGLGNFSTKRDEALRVFLGL